MNLLQGGYSRRQRGWQSAVFHAPARGGSLLTTGDAFCLRFQFFLFDRGTGIESVAESQVKAVVAWTGTARLAEKIKLYLVI